MVLKWSVSPLCWWGPFPVHLATVDTDFHYPCHAYLCIIFQKIRCLMPCWQVSKTCPTTPRSSLSQYLLNLKISVLGAAFPAGHFPFLFTTRYSWVFSAWKSTCQNLGKFFLPNSTLVWLLYSCSLLLSVTSTALECVALSDGFRDRQTMLRSLSLPAHTHWPLMPLNSVYFPCCILGSHVLAVADK